jgi:predicted flap endonuclease-1-like 5' DNA nuclease
MWSDLFKRWVDMMTWWMPNSDTSDQQAGSDKGQGSGKQAPSGSSPGASGASAKASSASGSSSSAGSTASAKQSSASSSQSGSATKTSGSSGGSSSQGKQSQGASQAADATSASGSGDDLTAIKGIGPSIQSRLNATGIRSFSDLAGADAEKLTTQLKEQMVISQKRVQQWIDEAGSQGK